MHHLLTCEATLAESLRQKGRSHPRSWDPKGGLILLCSDKNCWPTNQLWVEKRKSNLCTNGERLGSRRLVRLALFPHRLDLNTIVVMIILYDCSLNTMIVLLIVMI